MKAKPTNINRLLKTAKGQIDGVLKMIEDDRYCVDISNQLMAIISILKKVNQEILRAHIQGCVKDAFQTGKEEEKIEELVDLFAKITK
ncbi:TPA: metal-sensing transcriptional repressor [bacterium]|nr:metal-sensing transcriptional repressor [bacterium]